jgi:hypothetical protein
VWSEQARRVRRAARGNGPGKLDTAPPGRPNHDPVSVGADGPVEPEAAVPVPPLADRVLHGFGWLADRQLPHGTVIWTAPSRQVYTTKPGGALFFPALATSTGQLVIPESSGPAPSNRGLMMPTRQRTRAQDRAYRIALERQHNAARITRKQLLLAERIARGDQPTLF